MVSLDGRTRAALQELLDARSGIERLRGIHSLTDFLKHEELAAVRDALDDGADWESIADAAGLQPAAAKWRWQGTDEEIAERHEKGRKRSARPSSVPTDLPGLSVADAAAKLGISAQGVYLRASRGQLRTETVTIADGRSYKRVFLEEG
jgi:hypothetical protein